MRKIEPDGSVTGIYPMNTRIAFCLTCAHQSFAGTKSGRPGIRESGIENPCRSSMVFAKPFFGDERSIQQLIAPH
jgi:hypothetical protein